MVTALSFAFYTTSEVTFNRSMDESSFSQLNHLNLNTVAPAPKMDSSAFIPEFDQEINAFLKKWDIKGASVAVMKDNQLIYAKGYGVTNLDDQKNVDTKHLFRIASASKLITAIGIMKLVDDRVLDLNDKVFGPNGIFPEYTEFKDEKHQNITVGHLLNHKGGWSWRDGDFMFQSAKIKRMMALEGPPTEDDIIDFVLKYRRLRYSPGTQYAYSNFGYMLLGEIIAQKTNNNYEQYIIENILEPNGIYGMRLSGNYQWDRRPFEVHYYNHPGAYQFQSFDGNFDSVEQPYGGSDIQTLGAAGGWIANASQMVKLVSLIDPKNTFYRIISENSIQEMVKTEAVTDAYGWKGVKGDNWWRTGTLAGTNCFIYRKSDGYTYAVLLNSSVWMGYRFNKYIQWKMDDAIKGFDKVLEEKELNNLFWQDKFPNSILPLSS